jgi:hypothetical protein
MIMKTALSFLLVVLACVVPSMALAGIASPPPTPTTLAEHIASDGTRYYTAEISIPENLSTVSLAWLELRANVSAKDVSGFVDTAPVLDVYALKQTLTGDPEPSKFEVTRLPMSRPVAAGTDRLIKIDITEFVQMILANPSKNYGLVLGPLTSDKRGIFAVKQDGFGAGVAAQVRVAE